MRTPAVGMAVGALAVTLLATSATASAQAPPQDSVTANGSTGFFMDLDISVTSGPSGENPSGHWSLSAVGVRFSSDTITCLSVSGNTAVVAGSLQPNSFGFVGFTNTLVDNGPTGDTFTATGTFIVPETCPPPSSPGVPLLFGDITVIDAPPLPTSTEQCKNGGWQTFGVFKNQGDCVSFVATEGKNPPGGNKP